ncbi:Pimeloyl-ACP methyl ester carboxylesterase [Roseateles sp. YR242]|uniref:alpha/beta fold hydrolase n=1 Tax=Roseateles sp. YR242 TaxID=1855305 RepID=UPI0008D177D3|nr:alpha/beta hydrolase [Roseateles sp. YR242]SEK62834.1 Pimeloyl-ACP methyl ester carboxylesterase [Roseateles sp. YR242]
MTKTRRFPAAALLAALTLVGSIALPVAAATPAPVMTPALINSFDTRDETLVAKLPGFRNGTATVRGLRLHYVEGGSGSPVVLLPGWPETWWSYHKLMPELAKHHRVIALDLRGMGSSDKPADGYEKKSMAADLAALVAQLGLGPVDVVGHDIGAQVAYAFAANHPALTRKLVMLDVAHPDKGLLQLPLLPPVGTFGDKLGDDPAFLWWFAFHQVKGLPEDLLEGRQYIEQAWFFHYLLQDESAINAEDRAVYAKAYASRDAIRAGNAWYQAFPQDILDDNGYGPIRVPVLALGGPGYGWLKAVLTPKAADLTVVKMVGSGHFIPEEQPQETLQQLNSFLTH